jgi:arylsulfatase A-like enzyme
LVSVWADEQRPRPNIVLIVADDLGYGDLGCYGQQRIKTPRIDRLATTGLRFTDFYAGSTVCAPSRCALMTGLHTGHCRVRGNSLVPLEPGDVTLAEVLKGAGYTTGMFGKWGLGEPRSTGLPNRQGFDEWFGYLNQQHAHNYFPDYLWQNEQRYELPNVVQHGVATGRKVYSPELITREAIGFLDRHPQDRFFLYLPFTLPHANNEGGKQGMEIPSDDPYAHEPWPQPQKNHAAMITYLDAQVGRVLDKLAALGLERQTLVLFTSDNGPHREGGADPAFFDSSGGLRGFKRSLHDGGIRVPLIAAWPGRIAPGTTSSTVGAFWDLLPTLAELAGALVPTGLDGVSLLPSLLGNAAEGDGQKPHEYLYWEFHERGAAQALRMGNWKFVRSRAGAPLELYDLSSDRAERQDLAKAHPDVVARGEAILKQARTHSPHWPADPSAASR